jgi:hypothetical protein
MHLLPPPPWPGGRGAATVAEVFSSRQQRSCRTVSKRTRVKGERHPVSARTSMPHPFRSGGTATTSAGRAPPRRAGASDVGVRPSTRDPRPLTATLSLQFRPARGRTSCVRNLALAPSRARAPALRPLTRGPRQGGGRVISARPRCGTARKGSAWSDRGRPAGDAGPQVDNAAHDLRATVRMGPSRQRACGFNPWAHARRASRRWRGRGVCVSCGCGSGFF